MSNQAKTSKLAENYVKKTITKTFNVAVDGGAVGDIKLGVNIPAGGFITRAFLNKITAFTSAGAAKFGLYLYTDSTNDILADTQYDNAAFTGSFGACIPVNTPATFVKKPTTGDLELVARISTAALTAGKYIIVVEYMESR